MSGNDTSTVSGCKFSFGLRKKLLHSAIAMLGSALSPRVRKSPSKDGSVGVRTRPVP